MRSFKATQWTRLITVIVLACASSFTSSVLAQKPAGTRTERKEVNPFRTAYTTPAPSIARADLLACQELRDARVQNPRNLDVQEFRKAFTGTWVRELTWNGVVVQNNSALYFDFMSDSPTAMMYDQSNLGGGPMYEALEKIRRDPGLLAKTPRLTFVDCELFIVDTYFKISNDFVFDGLPVQATKARQKEGARALKSTWDQLLTNRFFRFEQKESRMAAEPGAEMYSPSVGGAHWQAQLEPSKVGGFTALNLRMLGDYRGAHVGEVVGGGEAARFQGVQDVQFSGTETAQFFMDGNYFVSSARPLVGASAALAGEVGTGWLTDCADFFDLPQQVIWERVVLDPGL